MPRPDPSMEPAIRDPKKLRNTALILVGMMILGGVLILNAYEKWSLGKAQDDRPAREAHVQPLVPPHQLRAPGHLPV